MFQTATLMALTRGLHLAATLSLLGTASFIAWILPACGTDPAALRRRLGQVGWLSGSVALLAGLVWFGLETRAIAGAESLADLWAALPLVAEHTRFGNLLIVRFGLLLVATVLIRMTVKRIGLYAVMLLAAAALGLQGAIGHAGATEGAVGYELVVSEALHLLAAGIWLGALLPLWLTISTLHPDAAARVCERFSPMGLACVFVLAGTGAAQALELIGSIPALFGTAYGHIALLKIALFLLALALAAMNRLWLTDRLVAAASGARRQLLFSVGIEGLIGLVIITAAAFMASNVPAAHDTPVWPFSWQFSLGIVRRQPAARMEVIVSLMLIGAAMLLMAGALFWHRFRLAALLVLAGVIAWRGHSVALLTTGAYPTSFQTSPTGFSVTSIAHGQALFEKHCAACHSRYGGGNGPAMAGRQASSGSLIRPQIRHDTDGVMFWWVSHGIEGPKSGPRMPGFGKVLTRDDIWALIDYMRAHEAGVLMQQEAASGAPIRAPAVSITCNGLAATALSDLKGKVVLVLLGGGVDDQRALPPENGVQTVMLVVPAASAGDVRPVPGSCVAEDAAAWNGFAALADVPPADAGGSVFLIDQDGWLRAIRRRSEKDGSGEGLLAAIRAISTHPIEKPSGGGHGYHH